MMNCVSRSLALFILAIVGGTHASRVHAESLPGDSLSAGAFTITHVGMIDYDHPSPILTKVQWFRFFAGRSIFNRQWESAESTDGESILGPQYIAGSCATCHINSGRGHPPDSGSEQLQSMLVRLSLPGKNEHGGAIPHPRYGYQIQNRTMPGDHATRPEADLYLSWQEHEIAFDDGETVRLRKPVLRAENFAHGSFANALTSLRAAPPLIGMGILDAIADETILALAENQRALGFGGKPNRVWDDINARMAIGRYGWKAGTPNLIQQVAAAASNDMGVSSTLYPAPDCPPAFLSDCLSQSATRAPEISDSEIGLIVSWLQGLAVPSQRDTSDAQVRRGARLFNQAQCAVCHVPELKTAAEYAPIPELSNQTLRAYTDLLLHDMGEGLADGRPEYDAGARDWRTPPLWGLGLSQTVTGKFTLLHDGRARNVVEAILWHDGEAARARDAFRKMSRADRDALVKFVRSI